jgi:hypothetical protein
MYIFINAYNLHRTPLRDQGNCGSCYAEALLDAFNMKMRVATDGKNTRTYSADHVVSCSLYNQGCDGGYPFLVAAHGKQFGFVPDNCDRDQQRCTIHYYSPLSCAVHNPPISSFLFYDTPSPSPLILYTPPLPSPLIL